MPTRHTKGRNCTYTEYRIYRNYHSTFIQLPFIKSDLGTIFIFPSLMGIRSRFQTNFFSPFPAFLSLLFLQFYTSVNHVCLRLARKRFTHQIYPNNRTAKTQILFPLFSNNYRCPRGQRNC